MNLYYITQSPSVYYFINKNTPKFVLAKYRKNNLFNG